MALCWGRNGLVPPAFLPASALWLTGFDAFDRKGNAFDILWAVVFGFATLNILGLVARRFETGRRRYNFGEVLAIVVVAVSVILLAWELLNLLKIFPIRLQGR